MTQDEKLTTALMRFVEPESDMFAPWNFAGRRYYCDGRMLASAPVDAPDDSLTHRRKSLSHSAAKLIDFDELSGEWIDWPVVDTCRKCRGTGHSIETCDDCDGVGDKECFHCGHYGRCGACEGRGKVAESCDCQQGRISIGPARINRWFGWKIAQLEGVRCRIPATHSDAIVFVFSNGGRGAVMPVDDHRNC